MEVMREKKKREREREETDFLLSIRFVLYTVWRSDGRDDGEKEEEREGGTVYYIYYTNH